MIKGEEVVLVMGGGWGLGIDIKLIEQQKHKLNNITIKGFVKNIQVNKSHTWPRAKKLSVLIK